MIHVYVELRLCTNFDLHSVRFNIMSLRDHVLYERLPSILVPIL